MNKITITKRGDGYTAQLNADVLHAESGQSPIWALGRLVLSHAKQLGIELEQPVERGK